MFVTTTIWNAFLKKLEKRLAARARIIEVDAVALAGLTADATWRTYDATAITSAKAKWIYLTVEWTGITTNVLVLNFRKYGRTNIQQKCHYTEVGSGTKKMTWNFKVAMDVQQRFQYNASAAGTLVITCTGYIETGRQWA